MIYTIKISNINSMISNLNIITIDITIKINDMYY
jgi:hypothetical protein